MKWQEKDRKCVCVSLTGLVMPIIFVSFAWACIGHFQYDKIQCTEQMWYPICLSYYLVACWAFSEIQGHLPHFQDQYMKFWFLRFHHFHRTFGDNFLMPFKMEWWTIIYVHVFVAWLDLQYFQNNNYILKT